MSTRSLIARKTADGFEAVYCHNDGYPGHHLPILEKGYSTDKAVEALIAGGDMSDIGKPYPDGEAAVYVANEEALLANAGARWVAYIYVFVDGRWFYKHRNDSAWRVATI